MEPIEPESEPKALVIESGEPVIEPEVPQDEPITPFT